MLHCDISVPRIIGSKHRHQADESESTQFEAKQPESCDSHSCAYLVRVPLAHCRKSQEKRIVNSTSHNHLRHQPHSLLRQKSPGPASSSDASRICPGILQKRRLVLITSSTPSQPILPASPLSRRHGSPRVQAPRTHMEDVRHTRQCSNIAIYSTAKRRNAPS